MARTGSRSPRAIAVLRGCRPCSPLRQPGASGLGLNRRTGCPSNPWRLQATVPKAVIKDISFASPTVGYIAGELGKVWKTTNGGNTWTLIMNLRLPVLLVRRRRALRERRRHLRVRQLQLARAPSVEPRRWPDVGLGRRAHHERLVDAGPVRGRSARPGAGLDQSGRAVRRPLHDERRSDRYRLDHSRPRPERRLVREPVQLPDRSQGVGLGDHLLPSPDGGASWNCRESVDEVFDGQTFFHDDQFGWVGGGSISPTVEGWMHRTADGGETWSGRTLDAPWPIREIRFVTSNLGSGGRGDVYSSAGGLYFSSDGGQTWSPRPRLREEWSWTRAITGPRARATGASGVVRGLRQQFRGARCTHSGSASSGG